MTGRALGEGIRWMMRRPGLAALLWGWNLALALVVTLPFWAWVTGATALAPETDALLDGFDIGLFAHLAGAGGAVGPVLITGVVALAMLSVLSGVFLSGGLLEVLTSPDESGRLLPRFFRGAGRFVGRFARLLAIAGLTSLVVVGLVGLALAALTAPLVPAGAEAAALWRSLAIQGAAGLAAAILLLAHDYARVLTALTDARSMLRTWLQALRFVLRRVLAVGAIAAVAWIAAAVTVVLVAAHVSAYSPRSWPVILGTIIVMQLMAFARASLRVAHVAAQAAYCRGAEQVEADRAARAHRVVAVNAPPAPAPAEAPALEGEPSPAGRVSVGDDPAGESK